MEDLLLVAGNSVTFTYRNHRGLSETRQVIVGHVWKGKTQWHPELQWFLHAWDLHRKAWRDFALIDIT